MKKLTLVFGLSVLALTACKKTESSETESNVMLAEPEVKMVADSTVKNNNPASADYPQADSGKAAVPTAANTPVTKTPASTSAPAENAPAPATK